MMKKLLAWGFISLTLVTFSACGEDFSSPAGIGKTIRKNWGVSIDGALTPQRSDSLVIGIVGSSAVNPQLAVFDTQAKKLLWKSKGFSGDSSSFTVNSTSVFKAESGGGLLAFDRLTGSLQGQISFPNGYKFEDSGFSPPQVVDNTFVVTSGGSVYAFDVSNPQAMKPLWNKTIAATGKITAGFRVEQNRVYVSIRPKSGPSVFALNLKDGSEIWSSFPDVVGTDPNESQYISGFVVANDKLIAFDANQKLYALNPNTGERLWVGSIWDPKKCYNSLSVAQAAIGADTLFLNAKGGTCMYGISLSTGQIKWIVDSEKYPGAVGTFGGVPLYHNGVVYSGNGNLFAVDADSGQVLAISSDVDPGRQLTQPYFINGEIVTWGRSITGFQPVR